MWSVLTGTTGPGAAPSGAQRRGAAPAAARDRGRAGDGAVRRGGGVGGRPRATRRPRGRGARPGRRPRTRGRSSSTRRCNRTRRGSAGSRAGEYGEAHARRSSARRSGRRRRRSRRPTARSRSGGGYEPEVDLLRQPVHTPSSSRPEDARRARGAASAASVVPALGEPHRVPGRVSPIGNMQLVAPRDEVVLAAGLAWERR